MKPAISIIQSCCQIPTRSWLFGIAAILFAAFLVPSPAAAQTLDGDIQDLIDLANSLDPEDACTFIVVDPESNLVCADVDAIPCSPAVPQGGGIYFSNGFDLLTGVIIYYPGTGELWLGIEVAGQVGDTDGNLDPDTICPGGGGGGIVEREGIGIFDGYRWNFDPLCALGNDFLPDRFIGVSGPTTAGEPVLDLLGFTQDGGGTSEVKWSGNGGVNTRHLEVKVTGISVGNNFPNYAFSANAFAGSTEDCVGENAAPPGLCRPPSPAIEVTKACLDVCAGAVTTCTITVTNTGLVPQDPVQIQDSLPTGHTYVGGSASGIGEPTGTDVLLFPEFTLDPGASREFSIDIQTPEDCTTASNLVEAIGTFTSPCYEDPGFRSALDEFTATYECVGADIDVVVDDAVACVGASATVPVTVTNNSAEAVNVTGSCTVDGPGGIFIVDFLVPTLIASGASESFDLPVSCDEAGVTSVCCTFQGVLESDPDCTDIAEDCGTATCVEAAVTCNVTSDEACVGEDASVTVTVTNTGEAAEDIVVNCLVDGVPEDQVYNDVPPGQSRNFTITRNCAVDGVIDIDCTVVASLSGNAECTATTTCSGTITCYEACIDLVVVSYPTEVVPIGSPWEVVFRIDNCAVRPETVWVNCIVEGVPEARHYSIEGGGSQTFSFEGVCQEPGPIDISCLVDAEVKDRRECADHDEEALSFECGVCGCVSVEVPDALVCVGSMVDLPVKVCNCDGEYPATMVLECHVEGGGSVEMVGDTMWEDVPPGECREVIAWLMCDEPGEITLVCTVTAYPDDPNCEITTDTDTGTIVCLEPCVELTGEDMYACENGVGYSPFYATNCGTMDAQLTFECWVDGFAREPYVVNDVPPGATVPFHAEDIFCRVNRAVEIECKVTIMYEGLWICKREASYTSYMTCMPDDLGTIVAADANVCAGIEAIVPVQVTNNGAVAETFTLDCVVDGVAQAPIQIEELAAGATMVVPAPMLCEDPGSFAANFSLRSGPDGHDCLLYDSVDITLNSTICAATGVEDLGLTKMVLAAYPNPVLSRSTTVQFTVPEHLDGSSVELAVFDVTGRKVKHLVSGSEPSGRYSVTWDLRDDSGAMVTAGVYFTNLTVGSERLTQRVLVMQQ